MKRINFNKLANVFLTVCAVVFGLTTLANAAVNPESISKAPNCDGGDSNSRFVSVSTDGDGKADVTVFRPSNGTWYVMRSQTGNLSGVQWGQNGDTAIAAAFNQ